MSPRSEAPDPSTASPQRPRWSAYLGAQLRLQRLLLRRDRLRWTAAVLLALPVLASVALLGWSRGVGLFDEVMRLDLFLLPFVPALATAPLLADETSHQTITYFLTRPAPRWTLPIARFAVVAPLLAAGFVAATVASYLVAMTRASSADLVENLGHLGRVSATVALGVPAYAALATAIGVLLPRFPMLGVAGYLLVVEFLVGLLPGWPALMAASWHLRQLAGLPQPASAITAVPDVAPFISALALVAITAIALAVAGVAVERSEPRAGSSDG